MRLGLLGYPITHSLSPKLYEEFLKSDLTSYELFSYPSPKEIPTLEDFAKKLDGLNITSPYKGHFIAEVKIPSPIVREISAINTIAFTPTGAIGTNTDVLAVEEILTKYQNEFNDPQLILLGSGVMAKVTLLVAQKLGLKIQQYSRKTNVDLAHLNLKEEGSRKFQNIVINSCSREFVFQGELSTDDIFWDYNYSFLPHQNTLPSQVKLYQDGQEMLALQAKAAIKFWRETNAKLK